MGPYEIEALLGSGGMGEVYRARDTTLPRAVALKVLPDDVARDPERLARFRREAHYLAALSHPHIAAIYGIEEQDGTRALVMELVEGPTLQQRLGMEMSRGLPVDEALRIGAQVAQALEAAHDRGIVHRDLKPSNIKIRPDGIVKVLDFGLAKSLDQDLPRPSADATVTAALLTRSGVVLGTPSYMSPEQVRGRPADQRSDIWAFGAVLYEMLTGRRPFPGESVPDTLAAIVDREPDWNRLPAATPAAVRRLLRRCLEKDARHRLRDIGDARLEIERPLADEAVSGPAARRRLWPLLSAAVLSLFVVLTVVMTRRDRGSELTFHQITFQRGATVDARFAPDGHVVYSARWGSAPVEIFSVREGDLHSRPLGVRATVTAVARDGTLAVIAGRTLARVPISGGESPRELMNDVAAADWSPDGTELAVVTYGQGPYKVYFAGKELYSSAAILTHIRVSPNQDGTAVVERPHVTRSDGQVRWLAADGTTRVLSSGWREITGLAFADAGREIWFTAAGKGSGPALYGVRRDGRERRIAGLPGRFALHDVSPQGAVLLSHVVDTAALVTRPKSQAERELSWLGSSTVAGVSNDGRTVLFDDIDDASGGGHAAYIWSIDGSLPTRLGSGTPLALSSDGQWVLATEDEPPPARLLLYAMRAGQPKVVAQGAFGYVAASFLPDGRRAVVTINTRSAEYQHTLVDLHTGSARSVTPTWMHVRHAVSVDGRFLLTKHTRQRFQVFPLESEERLPGTAPAVQSLGDDDFPVGWTDRSSVVWVLSSQAGSPTRTVSAVDLTTGARRVVAEIGPRDPTGVAGITNVRITPDGATIVYSYRRALSTLYVVRGLL